MPVETDAVDDRREVERALHTALQAALPGLPRVDGRRHVAVAFSGGGDSTALLHATCSLQAELGLRVFAFHIHHGLASDADAWLAHCREQAEAFGATFDAEHVEPSRQRGSIEATARTLRYAALTALCRRHRCFLLTTAHHEDDQAETVLLNLLRGAGVGGLAATARQRRLDDVLLLRPLLDLSARTLREHLVVHGLRHVDDPSNTDRRFTRNAIRHEVMPVLRRLVPTIASRLARTASHASSMQGLLDDIGREDLRHGDDDPSNDELDVERLAALSDARAANALRVWLDRRGMRAPSAAGLAEMLDQLLHASPDAQIALLHERQTLRLYRGRVSIERGGPPRADFRPLAWSGEAAIDVPEWNGVLHFEPAAERGFDARSLREGPLALRARRGGERMRVRPDGPSRTLKNLYQEAGIAAWRRVYLPLVVLGDRLLHAAGLGDQADAIVDASSGLEVVRLRWTPRE